MAMKLRKISSFLIFISLSSILFPGNWAWIENTEAIGPSWESSFRFLTPLLSYDVAENNVVTLIPVSDDEEELWVYSDRHWQLDQELVSTPDCAGAFGIYYNPIENRLMKFTMWQDPFCDAGLCNSVNICVIDDGQWILQTKSDWVSFENYSALNITYDYNRNRVIIWNLVDTLDGTLNRTILEFDGRNFHNVSHQYDDYDLDVLQMGYNAATQNIVFLASRNLGALTEGPFTYEYDGSDINITVDDTSDMPNEGEIWHYGQLVYHPSLAGVVFQPQHPANEMDPWIYREGTWNRLEISKFLPPLEDYRMDYDPNSNAIILYGGTANEYPYFNSRTFEFRQFGHVRPFDKP